MPGEGSSAPRTAVLSLRRQRAVPWFGWIRSLEDLLVRACGADLYELECQHPNVERVLAGHSRLRSRAAGFGLRAYRLDPAPPVGRVYDALFILVNDCGDLGMLQGLDGWQDLSTRTAVLVSEVWPGQVGGDRAREREVLGAADVVAIAIESAVEGARTAWDVAVRYLPPAPDVLRFAPRPLGRPISVFNPGRQHPGQHRAIASSLRAHDQWYQFDTGPLTRVDDLDTHITAYANLVSRATALVCNRARFDDPVRTGGRHEIGLRFFEALAGGAVIIGEFPTTTRFRELFSHLPGLVELPLDTEPDGQELDALQSILGDGQRLTSVMREHRQESLRHHDVGHRLNQLLHWLGLDPSSGLVEHLSHLEQLADAIE